MCKLFFVDPNTIDLSSWSGDSFLTPSSLQAPVTAQSRFGTLESNITLTTSRDHKGSSGKMNSAAMYSLCIPRKGES